DDRARFYREAKAAAQLHHPHIASVFEIDEAVPEGSKDDDLRPFIAMEYIEGETLDAKIKEGPLKLEDAVRIGSEIASALEAAHKKDIVHRDIKSGNVMLTKKGIAKVLDFGLAQTAQSTKLTRMGSTLGTIAYMSPEQARSEEVDRRTDIWSLGVVLYEMISGKHPFPGDYEQAAVYSILNEDPEPLTALRTGVPMAMEWIINKCLAKRAEQRYQSTTELIVDLEAVDLTTTSVSSAASSTVAVPAPATAAVVESRSGGNKGWAISAAIGVVAFILGALVVMFSRPTPDLAVTKFEQSMPGLSALAISHRGDQYAYVQNDTLFVRSFDSLIPRAVISTSADMILWSPDDSEIAIADNSRLTRVNSLGGEPQLVSEFASGRIRGATWLPSNDILVSVFSGGGKGEILRVPATGGRQEIFRQRDLLRGISSFQALTYLDDGDEIIAVVTGVQQITEIHLLSAEGDVVLLQDRTRIIGGVTVTQDEHLIFSDDMGLWSQKLSSDHKSLVGNPIPIGPKGAKSPTVSDNGTLLYLQTDVVSHVHEWRSLDGTVEGMFGQPTISTYAVLIHPDENRIVVGKSKASIWLLDDRGSGTPLATAFDQSEMPNAWLKDGRRLIYSTFKTGPGDLYYIDITSGEGPVLLLQAEIMIWASSLSPDEKTLVFYMVADSTLRDLYYVDIEVTPDSIKVVSDPHPFLRTPGDEANPDIHPVGDLLVYHTNISGRWEIAVRTFPDPELGFWPVTVDGGSRPRWHPDGKWIYYMTEDGFLWRIAFDRTSSSPVGSPERLFQTRGAGHYLGTVYWIPYDLGPKSGRIVTTDLVRDRRPPSQVVVQNWAQSLAKD
ncbi:MAG: protein kinase, partial [Bacteroidetes bacterium]|nr:protein kinase [Bacteroidota bacterium]